MILETAVTATIRKETLVKADFCDHVDLHLVGESATHPLEPLWGRLAALLLLVSKGPPRRRPCKVHPRSQTRAVAQADSTPSTSPAPLLTTTPSAALWAASNCHF